MLQGSGFLRGFCDMKSSADFRAGFRFSLESCDMKINHLADSSYQGDFVGFGEMIQPEGNPVEVFVAELTGEFFLPVIKGPVEHLV